MSTALANRIEFHRRLFIQKDLRELYFWIDNLENFNSELDDFKIIEKQLIQHILMASNIQAMRRKNILNMATLCKYEQELKKEYEYGKVDYDANRAKVHELKRANYNKLLDEYRLFKSQFYAALKRLQRK